jgi:RNA polymerase sigma-B factor
MMRSLTRTERAVVRLRFEHDLTQSEIGTRLGISQMQVSRVLRRSIAKLRTIADVEPEVVEAA